jgi:hypothetical protein
MQLLAGISFGQNVMTAADFRRVRQAAKPSLAQPASLSAQVVKRCVEKKRLGRGLSRPAPAHKAEPGKADLHHRPSRGFGHRASGHRLDDDRTIAKSLAVASRANGQDESTRETGWPLTIGASIGTAVCVRCAALRRKEGELVAIRNGVAPVSAIIPAATPAPDHTGGGSTAAAKSSWRLKLTGRPATQKARAALTATYV